MSASAYEEDFGASPDFVAVFAGLLAARWWLIGCVILSTAAFSAAAFLMIPVYRAATVLAPASTARTADTAGIAGQLGGLASVAGLGLGPRDAETEEALAVLRSRQFTEGFISAHDLMPRLFPKRWNAATATWKDDQVQPTPAKAYKLFDKKLRSILQDKKTGLVTVQIEWTDRNEAAAWANELVRLLNEEMRARAIANADASVRFLEKELEATSTVEARGAISRLMESQVKQRMVAHVTQDYSFRVVDKALPADADDPVGPKRLMLLAAGPCVGLTFGILMVLVYRRLRRQPASDLPQHEDRRIDRPSIG